MKRIIYLIGAFLMVLSYTSCKEDLSAPKGKGLGAPGQPTNVRVERLPGSVKLSYDLPNNLDLLYVKAEVQIGNKLREQKASIFNRSIVLEGFSDTSSYDIKLYAVSRTEERSEVLIVKAQPLEPPIETVMKSVTMHPVFGGIGVNYSNIREAEVSVNVLIKNTAGEWVEAGTLYTKRPLGTYSVRGFGPDKATFGVYIQDRWGNMSDTVTTELTPLFEQRLDRNLFQGLLYPTDTPVGYNWSGLPGLWDENTTTIFQGYHSFVGTGMPQWFTMDLGKVAKLSRIRTFQRGDMNFWFGLGNPKVFEIWGSNNPDADGGWNNWTRLAVCTSVKPSGSPLGTNTSEDIAYASAGEDFDFPLDAPAVKYIRFKTLQTWSNGDFMHLMELQFWGQIN